MPIIHINIGSNIDKENQIKQAIKQLNSVFSHTTYSSIYQSEAVGFVGDDFYNIGVNIQTHLSITEVNKVLHRIENSQGRDRSNAKFSARCIDLDLILYDNIIDKFQRLPRDDIIKHDFVLAPLVELNPNAYHPIKKQTYQDLWTKKFAKTNQKKLIKHPFTLFLTS